MSTACLMSIKIRWAIGLEADILIVRYKRGRQGSEGMSFLVTKKYQKYQILILKFVYCRHPVTLLNDSVINTLLLVCFRLMLTGC
jgi:hypothetical protein